MKLRKVLKGTHSAAECREKLDYSLTPKEREYVSSEIKKVEGYMEFLSSSYSNEVFHETQYTHEQVHKMWLKNNETWNNHPNLKVKAALVLGQMQLGYGGLDTLCAEVLLHFPIGSVDYLSILNQLLRASPKLLSNLVKTETITEEIVFSIWDAVNGYIIGYGLSPALQQPAIDATLSFTDNPNETNLTKLKTISRITKYFTILDDRGADSLIEKQKFLINKIRVDLKLEGIPDSWIIQLSEDGADTPR